MSVCQSHNIGAGRVNLPLESTAQIPKAGSSEAEGALHRRDTPSQAALSSCTLFSQKDGMGRELNRNDGAVISSRAIHRAGRGQQQQTQRPYFGSNRKG